MKKNVKYIFILLAIFVWGFIYDDMEKDEIANDIDTQENLTVSNMDDSVKLVTNGNLNVYYFDVGQADSILIENNGEYMLIDAGNNADGEKLVDYMKNMGVTEFQHVIATHAHEDHIGGMDDIINNFNVENFYMPDVITTTKTFEDVIGALEKKSVAFQTPNIGDIFILGGCKFEVVHLSDDDSDLNDTSIVVRGLYGDTSFLFMGDATSNVEKNILDSNIDSDVLKVGHHGSRYSSAVDFLNKVTPDYAIISVGEDNSYNHPHSVTFTKLDDVGAKVYRTDKDGTIVATSDGESVTFQTLDTDLNG